MKYYLNGVMYRRIGDIIILCDFRGIMTFTSELYHIIQINGEGPHREIHNYIIYYKVAHDDNFLTAESQRLT